MHQAVLDFVGSVVRHYNLADSTRVLEIGSRDLNGSVRHLFTGAKEYVGIDFQEGPGVDVVIDAADYDYGKPNHFDVVVCTEVLEHCPYPMALLKTAKRNLRQRSDALFIATMAAPGREPHSAIVEGPPQPGEWYQNIGKESMVEMLQFVGFGEWAVTQVGLDLQVWAR